MLESLLIKLQTFTSLKYLSFHTRFCNILTIYRNHIETHTQNLIQPEAFTRGVLRNFEKLTGKHQYQSLFFNKVADSGLQLYFKKRLWHRCFPVKFSKFLRTPFLQNTSERLFLYNVTGKRNCEPKRFLFNILQHL